MADEVVFLKKGIRNIKKILDEIKFLQAMIDLNFEKKGRQSIKKNMATRRATEMAIIRIASLAEEGLSERFPKKPSKAEHQYKLDINYVGKRINWRFVIRLRVNLVHHYFKLQPDDVLLIANQLLHIKPAVEEMLAKLESELEQRGPALKNKKRKVGSKQEESQSGRKDKDLPTIQDSQGEIRVYTATYNGEEIIFSEQDVAHDGSCGFSVLDTNREKVVNVLLKLSSVFEVRQSIAPVIEQTLMTEEEGSEILITPEWQDFKSQHARAQELLGEDVRRINDLLFSEHDDQRLNPDKLIEWLSGVKNDDQFESQQRLKFNEYLESLTASQSNFGLSESAIKNYCEREDVYTSYVRNGLSGKLWFDYYSMMIYARQKNIKVVIWQIDPTDDARLKVRYEDNEIFQANRVIHIIHTENYTHFKILRTITRGLSLERSETATQSVAATSAGLLSGEWMKRCDQEETVDDYSLTKKMGPYM